MPQSPLAPTQFWTIFVAAIAALAAWLWISPDFAWGLFLTSLWATVGFRALEGILRAGVRPKGQPRDERKLLLWSALKLTVYGLAVWVLFLRPFPVLSHVAGFTILMVALVILGAGARAQQIDSNRQSTGMGDDDKA